LGFPSDLQGVIIRFGGCVTNYLWAGQVTTCAKG